ncbi:MAG: regulatory protein RecX [bacterium]
MQFTYRIMKRLITDIRKQKIDPSRYSIFLDGSFFSGVAEETIKNFDLKCGKEIEDSELEKLLYEEEFSRAKDYVYKLLARRMYTKREIYDKLQSRKYSEKVIQNVISLMEEYGYLNDRSFAEEWIESRIKTKPKGKIALKQELMRKGIEESIIRHTLESKFDESKLYETAIELARRKIKSYRKDDFLTAKRKLMNFLIRRGFDFETINNIVEKVIEEDDR